MEKDKRTNNDIQEEFEDTKGAIRNNTMAKRKKKDKQRSTKQTHKTIDQVTRTPLKHNNTIRKTLQNTILTRRRGSTKVLRKGRKFLLHWFNVLINVLHRFCLSSVASELSTRLDHELLVGCLHRKLKLYTIREYMVSPVVFFLGWVCVVHLFRILCCDTLHA